MNEEREEVFRGHLEECLDHLRKKVTSHSTRGSAEVAAFKQGMAEFCGVSVPSVNRWFRAPNRPPVSDPLIKLKCYLNLMGYQVIEWTRTQEGLRNFSELIGFGLITGEEAARNLGYHEATTLYNVLKGQHGTSKDKTQDMWEEWKKRKEELQNKKREVLERYRSDISLISQPETETSVPTPHKLCSRSKTAALVHLVEAVLVLLDEEPSDSELANLRRSVGTIVRLSAQLSALSSRLVVSRRRKGGGSDA